MWKWVIAIAAVPVGLAAIVYAVGLALPRDHVARAEATLPAPPEAVAAIVRDIEAQPRWRGGVQRIEVRERREGVTRYTEHSSDGAIAFEFREERPGARFRSTIADPALPFSGSWTIDIEPAGNGTRIAIEEAGSVSNPVYRFFSALVFGHHATMNAYLADLRTALQR